MVGSHNNAQRASQNQYDAIWLDIRADADKRSLITLRAAANIIGFCEFPIGWSWHEYSRWRYEKPHAYEKRAVARRHNAIDAYRAGKTPEGKRAKQSAIRHRREHIETLLARFIRRGEIKAITSDETGAGHEPLEKIRLDGSTKFDIEGSGYGPKGFMWDCVVDAIDLVSLLEKRKKKGKRAKKLNWIQIECIARAYFETLGCPNRKEDVFDHVVKALASEADEPSSAMLKGFIAELRAEYEDSD